MIKQQQSSVTEQGTQRRFEGLEAFRGLAALLIVVFHAYQYSREGIGQGRYVYEGTAAGAFLSGLDTVVAWFFVLSGFLIFTPFARAALQQRPYSPWGFLVRRAIRILPAYYVAIVLVWTWRYTGSQAEWIDLVQHLTFMHIFDRTHIFWTIGPSWSLAVEVLLYVFIALLGMLLFRVSTRLSTRKARIAMLVIVTLSLIAASMLYKGWAWYIAGIPAENYPVYFGLLAKLDTFAFGMLIAILVAAMGNGLPMRGQTLAVMRIVGLIGLLGLVALRGGSELLDLYSHTISGLAFVLVLISTIAAPVGAWWARLLAAPLFQFLGVTSYSTYLWHEPIMIELGKRNILITQVPQAFPTNALILIVLSVAAGALSYWCLERPGLELRHLFTAQGRIARRYPDQTRSES